MEEKTEKIGRKEWKTTEKTFTYDVALPISRRVEGDTKWVF